MYNATWIENPGDSQNAISPAEAALKETYLAAQNVAFGLICVSNQIRNAASPDVNDCAALVRAALQKPENQRATAVKDAQREVIVRQVDYFSTLIHYFQDVQRWRAIRPTLVTHLEAVALADPAQSPHGKAYGVDTCLNCQAVADLIEECDIAINEAERRLYSRPTQKHAERAFDAAVAALSAEVTADRWNTEVRLACLGSHSSEILRDVPVDKVSTSEVPAEYVKCIALDAARQEFERTFCYEATTRCRDFNQSTRGTLNDTQFSERLLTAADLTEMLHVEQRRDHKLCEFGRAWRNVRALVDTCQALYRRVAELLPDALAEAAAIEDADMRRRAQNLCLFAARRLKENLRFIRECDRFAGNQQSIPGDTGAALRRAQQALIERIKSKEIHRPSTRCREEPYLG